MLLRKASCTAIHTFVATVYRSNSHIVFLLKLFIIKVNNCSIAIDCVRTGHHMCAYVVVLINSFCYSHKRHSSSELYRYYYSVE